MPGRYLIQDYDDPEPDEAEYDGRDAAFALLRAQLGVFRRRTGDYSRVIDPLDDGSFYWHLYYREQRINGGLSATEKDAKYASWSATFGHIYSRDTA